MLILAKITTGAAGGYAEYLEGKTAASELGDYYLKDGTRTEAPGRWVQGAHQFGLDAAAPVTGEQLHTLMAVRRPDNGESLRRAGGSGVAVAAIDATFSAPKSVSAVWALADQQLRERVEQAHETAIDRALTYATRQVPMIRRREDQDTVVHEKPVGLIATSWRHTTARAVEEQAPDPQLHSHVLLHGAVRRDGQVVAIDSRKWLVHQREIGAAYRTELARELNNLGFNIVRGTGRGGRYFEIDGVPQGLIDRWSSRHHQVQAAIKQRLHEHKQQLKDTIREGGEQADEAAVKLELLEQTGQLSPKEERLLGTITRNAKTPVTVSDLDTGWRRTALSEGFTRERVEVLRRKPANDLEPASAMRVLEALTEFDATFPARDARAVALEQSAGTPIPTVLDQLRELRKNNDILKLADGNGTTRQHRGRERTVIAITERLTSKHTEPIPPGLADREAERLDRELASAGGRLSDEQRAAITLACATSPLVIIEGQAGTGKSTTLTGIARAHQAAGQQILVTSTAALAAEHLATELHDSGVQCDPYSTAALHAAITHGHIHLSPQTTIIHDEAALAATREQLDLLDAIETTGARMIAVGDPQQNQPVGASGLWQQIEHATRTAGAHVELTLNQRAHDPADREDQALFRDGDAEQAIRDYATRGHVHLHDDSRRTEDQALDAAHIDRTAGKTTLVIAQTSNEHLDQLNARAQAIRQQHRELGEHSLPVPGRPYELHEGDLVQVRRTTQHPGREPLRNGARGQIATVDPDAGTLDLQLDNGNTVTLTEHQLADADLRLAYVQHPFPAQGITTDTTHLIVGEHATREGTYVALTRARDTTNIYASDNPERPIDVDRLKDLAERVNRTEPDLPSIHTPLAHETTITTQTETKAVGDDTAHIRSQASADREPEAFLRTREPTDVRAVGDSYTAKQLRDGENNTDEFAAHRRLDASDTAIDTDHAARWGEIEEPQTQSGRVWPRKHDQELFAPLHAAERHERDESMGWEP